MVDAAQGTIPVTPTTVWLYKKYNICERECQDRGRQKEIPDTYGKHAAPLARSSSVFGDFKKAESGSVQGATVTDGSLNQQILLLWTLYTPTWE